LEKPVIADAEESRMNFDMQKYALEKNLGDPVGGIVFFSETDEYSIQSLKDTSKL